MMQCKCLVIGPLLHAYICSLYLSTGKFQSLFHFTFGCFLNWNANHVGVYSVFCFLFFVAVGPVEGGGSTPVTPSRNLPVNASMPLVLIFM